MGKIVCGYNTYAGSTDNAKNVNFNNVTSGLDVVNVQDAIDEIVVNKLNNLSLVSLTKEQYDALTNKDDSTIYIVTE